MSLTRYLPTPSDRMGILWTLLSIEDAIILEYGTAGTTSYVSKVSSILGINTENRLFTTTMNQDDVVMGDTKKLEKKIIELDKTYSPKVIFVMASSVSSVIGSDVNGVISYMSEEVNAKLIPFTQGGFSGDYSSGIKFVYTKLIKELALDNYEKENSYNILGISSMNHSAKLDVLEINNMMNEYFGMKENVVLSYETNIDKIKKSSKAKINIVLSYEGLEAAKILKERFDIPYVYKLPIGYKATLEWLLEISKILDVNINTDNIQIPNIKPNQNAKALIYAEYDKALGLEEFLKELGINVYKNISTHNTKKILNAKITNIKTEKEKLDLFKSLNNTLILGDNTLTKTANNTNTHINVDNVLLDIPNKSISIFGIKSADYIKQECERYISTI